MNWFSGKRKILNFVIPLILALSFFSLSAERDRCASWYEAAFLNFLAPFQGGVDVVTDFFGFIWNRYMNLIDVSEENTKLKRINAGLLGSVSQLMEAKQENIRLRALLDYKEEISYPILTARVIGNDTHSEFKSITIDKGSKDGIDILMPVIGPRGLVGRISKLSGSNAQVLLVIDPNSAVDVLVQRSRARAFLVGTARKSELRAGNYISRLEYLQHVSDVGDGDVVVTSGFDKIYPPGIAVGTIQNIVSSDYGVFKEADVVPFENYAELEEVIVILKSVNEDEER